MHLSECSICLETGEIGQSQNRDLESVTEFHEFCSLSCSSCGQDICVFLSHIAILVVALGTVSNYADRHAVQTDETGCHFFGVSSLGLYEYMVVADLRTDHSGISNCILKSLGSTVQIVGAFLVGHVILVVGRKHGYQLTDTSVDLILAAGEVYKSCVLTLEFSGSGVTFGLVVAIQCVGGVYEKFCFLGLHER